MGEQIKATTTPAPATTVAPEGTTTTSTAPDGVNLVIEKVAPPEVATAGFAQSGPAIEQVTIPKSKLDALMARLDRVEFAANKSYLEHYDKKGAKDITRTVKLRTLDGKVIIFWDNMPENTVEKTPAGAWCENQKVMLHFDDKSELLMDLVLFNRRFKYIVAEIVSTSKENSRDGEKTIYKLKTSDGGNYEVDHRFVN